MCAWEPVPATSSNEELQQTKPAFTTVRAVSAAELQCYADSGVERE